MAGTQEVELVQLMAIYEKNVGGELNFSHFKQLAANAVPFLHDTRQLLCRRSNGEEWPNLH